MANSKTLQAAIAEVNKATEYDKKEQYKEALGHYFTSIEYFMHAKKYEVKGEKATKVIEQKIEMYLNRAELLKKHLDGESEAKKPQAEAAASSGGKSGSGKSAKEKEEDALAGALEGAIVVEKPNVKWDDVAGLEVAKENLKEAVILPVKFPHMFTGKRKPWKGILLYWGGEKMPVLASKSWGPTKFFSTNSSSWASRNR